MSYYTFPWYFQRFTDDSGAPLAGGSVTFYAAGSTAKKNIYLDQSGTIAPNPMPLDSVGFPESNYFGGPGEYDIYIKDSEGALVRKVLRVTSGGSGGFPDPTNSGYLHYDIDTDTYTWQEVDSDTYKVMTDSTDPTPGYLETKIVSSSEVIVTNTDHQLSMTVDDSVKYKVKVNTDDEEPGYLEQKLSDNVDVQWTPTADNKQLESIVYQLTGLGSALSPVKTDFQFTIPGPFADYPWSGGRGIAFGKIYVNGEHVNAWIAQSNSGHLYKTIDLWQTTIKDESDQPDASFYTRYGFPNSYGVGCISYVYMSNIGKNAWIVGVGNLARVYYVPDEPASYETNGFFKSTAWASIDYDTAVCSSPIDISFDAETHDTCFLGDDVKIGYTADFTTFTTAYTHTGIIAGIDNDGYGNVLACGKFDGVLFKSTDHGKPGTWAPISSIYLDGELVTHLPNSSEKGCQWGSVIGAYGQWAVFNYATVAGAPSFVWSDDGVYWYSYYGAVANFYGAGFDGVRFFATNPKINTNPPVYQVMISSIPSHRKFVAEKGLAVAGETFLYDIQDAQALGTDIHGRVVAKPLPAGSLAGLTDVALGTPENGQVLTFDEDSGKWINSAGGGYILPIASETALGGIKVGDRLSIDGSGVLSADDQSYTLPTASASTKGGVLVGARLAIAPDGVLSADDQSYTLPVATDTVLGGVKEGANVDIAADGTISVAAPYSLPTASSTVLGGIKVGDRLNIADGVLSAADQAYTLPAASDTVRGGIKVGAGLSIVGDVLSADGFTPVPATTTTLGEVIVGDNISVDLTGKISVAAPYSLPVATASVLGGVKVGDRLSVAAGVLSADDQSYTLPEATSTVLGGVKVGNGLQVDTGVIRCDDATVFKSQNAGASGLGYWTKILSINAPETNDHVSMRLQLTSSYTSIAMGVWHIDIESRNLAVTPAPTVSLIQGDGSYAATDVVVVVVNDYPTEPRLYEIWTRAIANNVEVGWTVRDIWSAIGASPVTWTHHSDTAWVASYSAGTAYPGADGRNIYTLPTASSTVKGGIKVGSGLSITTEVLNVTSAPILATARNLTIGSSTKSFNGSANVSWTLAEIGAQATLTNPITGTGTGGCIAVWSSTSTQTSYAGVTCNGTTIVSPGLAASAQGLGLANATPSTTTNTLYNVDGKLYWSGNPIGGVSGSGSAGKLGIWSSATGMTYDNNVSYASNTLSVPSLTTTAISSGVSTASIDVTGTLNAAGGFGIKLASVFPSVDTNSRLYNISGNLYWSGAIVGNVRGGTSGVANRVAYWTGTNSITSDADLTFDGTTLTATAASVGQGIELTSYTPGTVTNKLYNVGGALYWNGTAVGSNLTGTIYSVPHFDGSGNIISDAGFTVQQNTGSLSSYFYFGTSATNTSLTIKAKSGASESSNFTWYRGTGDGFTNHVFGIVTGDATTYFNGYGGHEFMRLTSGVNYPSFPSSIWLPTTAGNVIYLDSNQVATGNSGLTYDGTSLTVKGGVVLPSGAPAATTNKLYSVGGILYFNGVIVGGSSTGVFGNALINTSTNDGAAAFLGLNGYNGVLNTSSGIIAAATYMAVCNPGDVSVYAGSQSTRQFAVKSAEVATYVPTTIGSKLTLKSGLVASYDTLTANTTLVESTACYQQYINWSASTITVTLPASPTVGRKYAFGSAGKQWTLASGSTNIYVSGSSTPVASVIIPASQPLIEVVYMGTSWFVA